MKHLLRSFSLVMLILLGCGRESAKNSGALHLPLTADDVAFIEGWHTWKFDPFAAEDERAIFGWKIVARKSGVKDVVLAEVVPQYQRLNDGHPCILLFALKLEAGAFVCSYQFKGKDTVFSARQPRAEGMFSGHIAHLEKDIHIAKPTEGSRVLLRAYEVVDDKRQPIDVVLEFHRKPAVR